MNFKIFILVALVLCLTLSIGTCFADTEESIDPIAIESGLLVDAYNWFNDTFFGANVPPLLESLSEEICSILSLLLVGSIIAIPVFLVWVIFKSVVAMSLFNR